MLGYNCTVCYALGILPHALGTAATLYFMLCSATCVGTAATSYRIYRMLCSADTVACVGTGTILYCMLCTAGVLARAINYRWDKYSKYSNKRLEMANEIFS